MTYIQAHPTYSPVGGVLVTEAVRGNGAILVNDSGERFVNELTTRDVARDVRVVAVCISAPSRYRLGLSDAVGRAVEEAARAVRDIVRAEGDARCA